MSIGLQLSLQPTWDDREAFFEVAAQEDLGIEIASLTQPAVLDDTQAREEQLIWYQSRPLHTSDLAPSFHGAFLDLTPHSPDPAVAGLAQKRFVRDLQDASRLGCRRIVFHTGYNPMVRVDDYQDIFLDYQSEFWRVLADSFPDLTICLENVWEPSPDFFQELLVRIDHPRVRMCLDLAHANVYSDVSPIDWLRELNPFLGCMHWNDNAGEMDSHLALGEGNIDWPKAIQWTSSSAPPVPVTLEFSQLDRALQSLEFLRKHL